MLPFVKERPRWGFVCGRLSTLEGRLSNLDFFYTLIAQERTQDLVPQLQDTLLAEYLDPASPWEDFSALAERCFYEYAMSIREDCPDPAPVDLLLLQNDYLNVKNALAGAGDCPFRPGLVDTETAAAAKGGGQELPGPLGEAAGALLPGGLEIDPATLDLVLDGAYLRHLLALAAPLDAPLITAWVRDAVFARAVVALWRMVRGGQSLELYRQHFLPVGDFTFVLQELCGTPDPGAWPAIVGGPLGDGLADAVATAEQEDAVGRFELFAGNHLTRIAKEGRMQTAGPERVFSFLAGLHVEMQNIRLVVCGLLSRVAPDALRNRLRECYG